ncbi:hypothetical protein OC861_001084 [Tilletia horrida]|nr:hypothetical protein OC861_001084 [Tilletia horrida]
MDEDGSAGAEGDEADRRRRKEKGKSRRADSESDDDDDDAERERRRHRRRSSASVSEDGRHARKNGHQHESDAKHLREQDAQMEVGDGGGAGEDDDVEVGPQLPVDESGAPLDPRSYGGALRPGEGSAMAAYVASGQRIPRRGEIGLQSEQIEKYEAAGFVMSGSRHRRMNAVRMRKENQVISAEEQRAILKMRKEEKMKREGEIVSQFKELVDTMGPGQ